MRFKYYTPVPVQSYSYVESNTCVNGICQKKAYENGKPIIFHSTPYHQMNTQLMQFNQSKPGRTTKTKKSVKRKSIKRKSVKSKRSRTKSIKRKVKSKSGRGRRRGTGRQAKSFDVLRDKMHQASKRKQK